MRTKLRNLFDRNIARFVRLDKTATYIDNPYEVVTCWYNSHLKSAMEKHQAFYLMYLLGECEIKVTEGVLDGRKYVTGVHIVDVDSLVEAVVAAPKDIVTFCNFFLKLHAEADFEVTEARIHWGPSRNQQSLPASLWLDLTKGNMTSIAAILSLGEADSIHCRV